MDSELAVLAQVVLIDLSFTQQLRWSGEEAARRRILAGLAVALAARCLAVLVVAEVAFYPLGSLALGAALLGGVAYLARASARPPVVLPTARPARGAILGGLAAGAAATLAAAGAGRAQPEIAALGLVVSFLLAGALSLSADWRMGRLGRVLYLLALACVVGAALRAFWEGAHAFAPDRVPPLWDIWRETTLT